MQITLDTENLSAMDRAMLGTLLGSDVRPGGTVPSTEPAKKAAAAPAKKAAAAPAKVEPEAPAEAASGSSLEDAVALATDLVSDGKANRVKLALDDQGAPRVGKLDAGKIPAFIEQLTAFAAMSDDEFKAEEDSRG